MKRYWARITETGTVSIHDQRSIGQFFFTNAASDKDRVAVVVLTEVPMTPEEAELANPPCPTCGHVRSPSASPERPK